LEALVRVANISNDPKAKEYEGNLDEVQRHFKSLSPIALKDLMVTLSGDTVKARL